MKRIILAVLLFYFVTLISAGTRKAHNIDETWICNVKRSCLSCLLLSHCSWCPTENKCFSKKIRTEDYCKNDTIGYEDFGWSLAENAECACTKGDLEQNCYPPGVEEGPKCSGRGDCVCGRCICDATPDTEHPTKMVMGEFCEYDNFSCDGPKCNEGPYSLSEPAAVYEKNDISEVEQPESDVIVPA